MRLISGEVARAKQFTSIYNDVLKRVSNKYGEKVMKTVFFRQIYSELGISAKTSSSEGASETIDKNDKFSILYVNVNVE